MNDMQPPAPWQPPENIILPPDGNFGSMIQTALVDVVQPKSDMKREVDPDQTSANKALVKQWLGKVEKGKEHFSKIFKKMREDQDFVSGKQWEADGISDDDDETLYVANITQRHLKQQTASIYAKNPKVVCTRRHTMDFELWDESRSQLLQLQAEIEKSQQPQYPMGPPTPQNPNPPTLPPAPLSPEAQALMADVSQGILKRKIMNRISKTMEIVIKYQMDNHNPPFKGQMKQLVRRVGVTGVGWIKLGYQRFMEHKPEDVEKITDITQQLEQMDRLIDDMVDDETTTEDPQAEQLRLMLKNLQENPTMIVKEGVTWDFPRSNQIIVDPACTDFKSLSGAKWVAQQFILSVDDVKEIYKVDLGKEYAAYQSKNADGTMTIKNTASDDNKEGTDMTSVWEVYSKKDGLVYTVCEGYPEFLKDPEAPTIKLERFWPFFGLTFNVIENDKQIYPQSDVQLLRPMQMEYNRCRQGLREQRQANLPKYAVANGKLSEEDMAKLANAPANTVFQISGLSVGEKIGDVIQHIKPAPIDPAVYDTSMVFEDVQRVSGDQEANLGGTSGASATESGIAESNRMTSISSSADELNDFLNLVMEASGQVLLLNMDKQTVVKIAGKGAAWPEMNPQQVADELLLQIESGSNGRPNHAAEVEKFQRIAPFLLQIPGISPEFMAKEAIKRLDDNLDPTDAIQDALQSIVAMNAQKQISPGNPSQDPNAQGGAGPIGGPQGPTPGATPPPVNGAAPQVANKIPMPANQNQ